MNNIDCSAIGQRIKELRKSRGLNQQELANILGKSLRTIQKYETGEIEVSISMINELAKALETSPTFIIGYETNGVSIKCIADIIAFLFRMEQLEELDFQIDVKRPPYYDDWSCSITFNGKSSDADYNADMCLFLERWNEERENFRNYMRDLGYYQLWKDKTLAYYSRAVVTTREFEELNFKERIKRRDAILNDMAQKKRGEE